MSSSNLVSVRIIEEAVYGVTPVAGNFKTARFISESLSGTPTTVESQQIRTDRYRSGQVLTGLNVGGDLNFEFAKEDVIELLISSAMMNPWQTFAVINVDLTIDTALKKITRATGTWPVTLKKGDICTLSGFLNTENNTQIMVKSILSTTEIEYISGSALTNEVGTGTGIKQADKLVIGVTKISVSLEKAFLDLTTKAIIYTGMLVSSMSLAIQYGQIVNGTFTFSGNGYREADTAGEFITNGRTIDPAATTQSMNGSVDMPFVANSAAGAFDASTFCIQSLNISLDNQLSTQTCIGEIAPTGYSPGTAAVAVELGAYLSDANWAIINKKLTQTPFEVGGLVKNNDGWLGFYMPAVQTSFDDPSSGGANQDVTLEMSGTARVGDLGESPLTFFRS